MGAEAIGVILSALFVAFIGWIEQKRRADKREADADRLPGMEAARDAEAFKAGAASDSDPGIRMHAEEGAPRILGPVPDPPHDPD